jgi:hypothetical protein
MLLCNSHTQKAFLSLSQQISLLYALLNVIFESFIFGH